MAARRGDTLLFPTPPVVAAHAAIGGKKEGEGPLAACFDELSADNFFGQSNWEAAEKEMALRAARLCLKKAVRFMLLAHASQSPANMDREVFSQPTEGTVHFSPATWKRMAACATSSG